MYEIADFLRNKQAYSTAIIKCPTGWFTLVGSVPSALCHPGRMGDMVANAWETEQEAIDALVSIGITRFQRAGGAWYEAAQ